jgi:hypothetical protein
MSVGVLFLSTQRYSGAVLQIITDIIQITLKGTDRFLWFGEVFGSVGSDVSNLSINKNNMKNFIIEFTKVLNFPIINEYGK